MDNKGFTLIEILAVIIIIGILMMIVTPIAIGIIEDAKNQSYDTQISSIKEATRGYIADNGINIVELQTVPGFYEITLQLLVNEGYIDTPIKNPKTGNDFNLTTTTILITKLSNGTYSYVVNDN